MPRALLAIGPWRSWRSVVASATANGWSVFHTVRYEDTPTALERGCPDLVLLSGCSATLGWERVSRWIWAIRLDVPVVACGGGQFRDPVIRSLIGLSPAPEREPAALAGPADCAGDSPRGTPAAYSHSLLTSTLTLFEPVADPAREAVRKVLDFLAVHYAEPISLADAARVASYSRCHFCKLFKQQAGVSFVARLTTIRVERAAELLSSTEIPITDIAFQVGFNHLSHFERVFRSISGHSPSHFRQLAKDSSQNGQHPRSQRASHVPS